VNAKGRSVGGDAQPFRSVREAAKRLECGKNVAAELFDLLEDHGFIRPTKSLTST
jgi:DNA-binding transcriptional regulator YhcF (GntR family)